MMEAVENLALKNILLDAAAKEFEEELHEKEPVVVSDRFRWQMLRMLSNPNKWAKEQHRGSAWTRCLQSVAVFFDMFCSGWIDYGSESDCPCCYYYLGH